MSTTGTTPPDDRGDDGDGTTRTRARADASVQPGDFRTALRQHAAGVVVVTLDAGAGPVGFTATSFASASLDPPLVTLNLAATSGSAAAMEQAQTLVVHVLAAEQRALAQRFAARGVDRFAPPTDWRRLPTGEPLLTGTPTWLRAAVERRLPVGDHVLVVARVLEAVSRPAVPLAYHDGEYHRPVELEGPPRA